MTQIIECNNDFTIFSNSNILSYLVMLLVQILTYIDYNWKYNHALYNCFPHCCKDCDCVLQLLGSCNSGMIDMTRHNCGWCDGKKTRQMWRNTFIEISWVGSFTKMVYLFFSLNSLFIGIDVFYFEYSWGLSGEHNSGGRLLELRILSVGHLLEIRHCN